jgi:hypothetical protein
LSPPLQRPFLPASRAAVASRFERAVVDRDAAVAAHCIHELWMRHEPPMVVEALLERLWAAAPADVPEWLPMRYVEWLPLACDVAARFEAGRRGRSNVYLVLLDYADSARGPYGVYVGATKYSPSERFDQHKAGIRAAGSVLKRGLEVLTGPVLHLQGITARQAAEVEQQLAEALAAKGLIVRGGH